MRIAHSTTLAKSIFALLTAFLASFLTALPTPANAGLVGLYTFEGNTNDASGAGNNPTSGSVSSYAAGVNGQAAFFSGGNDKLILPINVSPNVMPTMTMGAWVKATTTSGLSAILSADDESPANYDRQIGLDTRSNGEATGGGAGGFSTYSAFCGGSNSVLWGGQTVSTSEFTFVAVRYDGSRVTLFIGDKVFSANDTTDDDAVHHPQLWVGKNPFHDTFFQGYMDNVFVFDHAVSNAKLRDIKERGAPAIVEAGKTGKPVMWGNNSGNLNVPTALTANGAMAGKNVTSIDSSYFHTIAVTSEGKAYTWGSDDSGVLGNGAAGNQSAPFAVDTSGVLAGKFITEVSTTGFHTLALTSDGKIYAWGANNSGHLGIGTNSPNSYQSPVAVDMSAFAGRTVVSVHAGGHHCLALTSDGKLFGWGENTYRQLGDGTTTNRFSPIQLGTTGLLAGKTIKQVAAGLYHSLVLTSDGGIYSWGQNQGSGALGDGTTTNQASPVAVVMSGVLAGKTIKSVDAGTDISSALTTEGKVYGWGIGSQGSNGNGSFANQTTPAEVNMAGVLAGKTILSYDMGGYHTVALASDGNLYSWGRGGSGQLGNGSGGNVSNPVAVTMTAFTGKTIIALESSENSSTALVDTVPNGIGLDSSGPIADGGSAAFGRFNPGTSSPAKTFTISNTSAATLTGLSVTPSGGHAGDFSVNTSGMATSLAPSATTTFTVTFTPGAAGARNATLSIASSLLGSDAFLVTLTGSGNNSPVVTLNGPTTQSVGLDDIYTELGATANDAEDGAVTITASGSVNTAVIGTYTRTYTATDSAGLIGSVTRTINVAYSPFSTISSTLSGSPSGRLALGSDGSLYGVTSNGGANSIGSVFKWTAPNTLTTLASFTYATTGGEPNSLMRASDGNFYGTTPGGGANGGGTVFKVTPAGVLSTLVAFNSDTGTTSYGGLVQDSDGNLVGTAIVGGPDGVGTVFKVTTAGVITRVASFPSSPIGEAWPTGELVIGGDGSIYGTTIYGGYGYGTIFKVSTAGVYEDVYFFEGGNDGYEPLSGLLDGGDGSFYGTTRYAGMFGNGNIFKYTPGGSLTNLASLNGANGSDIEAGLTRGADGSFYGRSSGGGEFGYGTIFKVTPTGTLTALHSFESYNPDPSTPIFGMDGNLYGAASPLTIWRYNIAPAASAPVATTSAATGVSASGATLNGTVNPGGAATTVQFQYGLTNAYGSTASVTLSPDNGTSVQNVSATLTGLAAHTTYHYRLSAANSAGTANTTGDTFTTLNTDPIAPSATVTGTTGDAQTLTISFPATDADGDTVSITGASAVAGLSVNSFTANTVTFTPNAAFTGNGSFTYTVSDGFGGTATGTITVAVTDNDAPSVASHAPVTAEATSASGATVTYDAGSASDNIGVTSLTYSKASGTVFPVGATTVTITAQDAAGNTGTDTFTVTVRDTTAPVVTVPANMTIEATSAAGAIATFSTSATDIVDGTTATTATPASGSTFPLGATTVNVTSTDAAGNNGSASFTVTVRDTTAPVVAVHANVSVPATSAAGATVSYAAGSASDLVGVESITYSQNSGTTFPLGTTTVTITARDAANNAGTGTFTVTVTNNEPAGTDNTVTTDVFTPYQFTAADFGFTDPLDTPSNAFSAVKITTLPATGALTLGGSPVSAGQSISVASSPAGDTWTTKLGPTLDTLAIGTNANGNVVVAGQWNGTLQISTDGGATWTPRMTDATRAFYSASVSDNGQIMLVAPRYSHLYTSHDGGVTWVARDQSRFFVCTAMSGDGSKMYAGDANFGFFYVSGDSGVTWSPRFTDANRNWTGTSTSADGTKVVATVGGGYIYTSTDSGATWTARMTDATRDWRSCAMSADGTRISAVTYGGKIYTSSDSGATFTARDSNRGWISISCSADGSSLVAAEFLGTLFVSHDYGVTWTTKNASTSWRNVVLSDDGSHMYAVAGFSGGGRVDSSIGGTPTLPVFTPAVSGADSFTFQVQDDGTGTNLDQTPNTMNLSITAPNIAVEEGSTALLDATGSVSFGISNPGVATAAKTFTIRNVGTAPMSGISVSKTGADAGDFTLNTSGTATSLAPNATTTFTVTFTPASVGAKTAALLIASNVAGANNPFDIALTGDGNHTPVVTLIGAPTATAEAGSIYFAPGATANDVEDGALVPVVSGTVNLFVPGTYQLDYTATDSGGLSDVKSRTVTVVDTTAPVVTVPGNITLEATGAAGAVATFSTSAIDIVSGPTTTIASPASGSIFAIGTTTVNVISTDAAGNTGSASFTVTVQDTTAPAVTVPANMTIEATSAAGAVVTFSTSATDIVDGSTTTTATPASGSTFAIGTTTVNVSSTDAASNTGSASFTVTVLDTLAPVIIVPADITVGSATSAGSAVTFTVSATDIVGGAITPVATPASGSSFPVGTTIVNVTATDAAGNMSNSSFNVTVLSPDLSVHATDDAALTSTGHTRIYPLANDFAPSGTTLTITAVSEASVEIDGRTLVIPAGYTGTFSYIITDGTTEATADVEVTAGTVASLPKTWTGLLYNSTGAIAGRARLSQAAGGTKVLGLTVGKIRGSARFAFPAESTSVTGLNTTVGVATIARNAEGLMDITLAGGITGTIRPSVTSPIDTLYNVAVAGVDDAMKGGGFGTIRLRRNGIATVSLLLPDGRRLATSGELSDNGTINVFGIQAQPKPTPEAFLGGEFNIADLTTTDITGELEWKKPAAPTGLFAAGLDTVLTINGCAFTGNPGITDGPAIIRATGGGLVAPLTLTSTVAGGKVASLPGQIMDWVIHPVNKMFRLRFYDPTTRRIILANGIYLPKSGTAHGFFRSPTSAGVVELSTP